MPFCHPAGRGLTRTSLCSLYRFADDATGRAYRVLLRQRCAGLNQPPTLFTVVLHTVRPQRAGVPPRLYPTAPSTPSGTVRRSIPRFVPIYRYSQRSPLRVPHPLHTAPLYSPHTGVTRATR